MSTAAQQRQERIAAGMRRIDRMLTERGIQLPEIEGVQQSPAGRPVPVAVVLIYPSDASLAAAAHRAADARFDADAWREKWRELDAMIKGGNESLPRLPARILTND